MDSGWQVVVVIVVVVVVGAVFVFVVVAIDTVVVVVVVAAVVVIVIVFDVVLFVVVVVIVVIMSLVGRSSPLWLPPTQELCGVHRLPGLSTRFDFRCSIFKIIPFLPSRKCLLLFLMFLLSKNPPEKCAPHFPSASFGGGKKLG